MLPGLAAYNEIQARTAEGDWRVACGHFTDSLQAGGLVEYPQNATCTIVPGTLINLADMQWRIRSYIDRAVFYRGGTDYREYCRDMRRSDDVWRFEAELPAAPHFSLQQRELDAIVDDYAKYLRMPEETRLWYRAQVAGIFRHAELLCEQGCAMETKSDRIFGELTGAAQRGRIKMMATPRSLHFRCESKDDCARLIYPNEATPSLEQRRGEIRTCRGVQVAQELPKTLGGKKISITAENVEVTRGEHAFGTFEHEQEHTINAFAIHRSTCVGTAPVRESAMEECGRLGVSAMVKEELIAWSLRNGKDLQGLFMGNGALYFPVKSGVRLLRDRGVDNGVVSQFSGYAGTALDELVPAAADAVRRLKECLPHSQVREMLRIVPVHEWAQTADTLLKKRRR